MRPTGSWPHIDHLLSSGLFLSSSWHAVHWNRSARNPLTFTSMLDSSEWCIQGGDEATRDRGGRAVSGVARPGEVSHA